jgi:nucleoside-diphosphate-sugar epimerase
MIVVVTGGNSFLASHLIPFLVDQGATVFATYRTSDSRLESLRNLAGVKFVQLDVSERRGFDQLPREADALVHVAAASVTGPGRFEELISCNVIGAQNVVHYARAARVKKLIYTSSISVYGDIRVANLDETYPITNPNDYGLTKYVAERLFAEAEGLQCVALRLPGTLGKGAHRAWIPSLLQRVKHGRRDASIYSPASMFNNAAHVDEISRFVWLLLNSEVSGFKAVNVAADGSMTVTEVLGLMEDVLGAKIALTMVPPPKPPFIISSEAAKKLGYKTRSINQILRCYFEESASGR